jgi:hypothetical protein
MSSAALASMAARRRFSASNSSRFIKCPISREASSGSSRPG